MNTYYHPKLYAEIYTLYDMPFQPIEEVTDTTIRTSNLWLAASLFAKGTVLLEATRQGVSPYLLVFTFPNTPRAMRNYGKYKNKTLTINMYTFYVAFQELKNYY